MSFKLVAPDDAVNFPEIVKMAYRLGQLNAPGELWCPLLKVEVWPGRSTIKASELNSIITWVNDHEKVEA